MRATLFAATAALALLANTASASIITMQTRYYRGPALGSAEAYRTLIDGLLALPATPGYGDAAPTQFSGLSNFTTVGGPKGDYAAKFTIDFILAPGQAGMWDMQFGVDFGRGGALFVDGAAMAFNPNDMWWSNSYANPARILQTSLHLDAGQHQVTLYGIENCCDGRMQGRFRGPGTPSWTTFATNDPLTPVPAPASLGVFAMGLLGLACARRRLLA
jgi:hypothetical protein